MKLTIEPPIEGPPENRDFAERFRVACDWAGLLRFDPETKKRIEGGYAEIARAIIDPKEGEPITRQYAGELYKGIKVPSGRMQAQIAKCLGVSPSWLMAGVGPMVFAELLDLSKIDPAGQEAVRAVYSHYEQKGADEQ